MGSAQKHNLTFEPPTPSEAEVVSRCSEDGERVKWRVGGGPLWRRVWEAEVEILMRIKEEEDKKDEINGKI